MAERLLGWPVPLPPRFTLTGTLSQSPPGRGRGWFKGEGVNGCIFVGGWTLLLLKYSCSRGWRVFGWMLVELAGPIAAPIHPHRDPLLISPWKGEGDDSRERV